MPRKYSPKRPPVELSEALRQLKELKKKKEALAKCCIYYAPHVWIKKCQFRGCGSRLGWLRKFSTNNSLAPAVICAGCRKALAFYDFAEEFRNHDSDSL